MNKLFTKIGVAMIGFAMAIGVGVAVGNKVEFKPAAADSSVTIAWTSFGIDGTLAAKSETTSGYNVAISSVSNQGVGKGETINNTVAFPGSITSITVNGAATGSTKTDGTFEVFGGNSSSAITTSMGEVTGLSSTASNKTVNFTGSYSFFKITVGSARTLKFTNITVYYSTAATFTVTDSITNGSLSSTSSVLANSALNLTINGNVGYARPASLTVTMGGNSLAAGVGYTYNSSTGAFSIASVTGNVVIAGTCQALPTYDVTYVAGANGSGTDYVVANQYAGSYTLMDYEDLEAEDFAANDGYIFKCYTVGGVEYDPGSEITISSDTTVTVTYKTLPGHFEINETTFTKIGTGSGYGPYNGTRSISGYNITSNQVMVQSSKVQFQKTTSAYLFNETAFTGIKLIRITGSGTIKLSFDDDTAGSGSSSIGDLITAVTVGSARYYVPTISNAKYFHIVSANSDTASFSTIEVYDCENAAITFANDFVAAMATPCADQNANNKTAVSAIWATYKNGFEALTSDTKTEFGTSKNSTIVQARSLYLHCVARYGLTAWENGPVASSRIINNYYSNSGDSTIIIVIASTIALVSIAGYFVIRRKKEN